MRLISFALTTRQYEDGSKDVTRRQGWAWLVRHFADGGGPVELGAVRKGQGIPKGGKVERLNPPVVHAIAARREPLRRMTDEPEYGREECRREGFPDLTPGQFVAMYCEHNGGTPEQAVTRIELRRVESQEAAA